jgi:hypothetical protein
MNQLARFSILIAAIFTVTTLCGAEPNVPDSSLKVVIIRHAEKPDDGDDLSCQGFNRSLLLPKVLEQKFDIPAHTYVPALECGKSTSHSRMFQTVTPFAVKHNLKINSKFGEDEVEKVAEDVLGRTGTVLIVWEHSKIPDLAKALKVAEPGDWKKHDFDSIWVITFPNGQAKMKTDSENLAPAAACAF